jgi:hypothetical protein
MELKNYLLTIIVIVLLLIFCSDYNTEHNTNSIVNIQTKEIKILIEQNNILSTRYTLMDNYYKAKFDEVIKDLKLNANHKSRHK